MIIFGAILSILTFWNIFDSFLMSSDGWPCHVHVQILWWFEWRWPHSCIYLNAWSSWWKCLGRIIRYGLLGWGVPGVVLRFQKPTSFILSFLSSLCLQLRCKLSVTASALWLPACDHDPWQDSHGHNPLEPWSPTFQGSLL